MSGLLSRKARIVSTVGSVLASDEVLLADAASAAFALTLPAPGTYQRDTQRIITIMKFDSSQNIITVNGLIENFTSYLLACKGDSISLYTHGGVWKIIDRNWCAAGVRYPISMGTASYSGTGDIPASAAGWDAARVLVGSARQHSTVTNGIAMLVPFLPAGLFEIQYNGDFRAGSSSFDARAFFRLTTIGDTGFMHVQNFPSALSRGMRAIFFNPTPITNFEAHVRWQTTNAGTSIQITNGNGFTDETTLSLKNLAWNG